MQTVIEAERAFAADAQRLGQWAAFRKWAAADATMFVPQPVKAQAWLKDRAEPAKAIAWWPTAAWVSCDGTMAVDTGGWRRPDGSVGYFTTVWARQSDGRWKWLLDHGDTLTVARPRLARVRVVRADCRRPITRGDLLVEWPDHTETGGMTSHDGTLVAGWSVTPDRARRVEVSIAKLGRHGFPPGRNALFPVFEDEVAAPK